MGIYSLAGNMKNKGFSMIPNQVIWDNDLSNNAKLLFCYLRSLSDKYRTLRNRTLIEKLGVSLNTLQSLKAELVQEKYLIIHRKTSANYYELKAPYKVVLPYPNSGQLTTLKLGSIKKSNTTVSYTHLTLPTKRIV